VASAHHEFAAARREWEQALAKQKKAAEKKVTRLTERQRLRVESLGRNYEKKAEELRAEFDQQGDDFYRRRVQEEVDRHTAPLYEERQQLADKVEELAQSEGVAHAASLNARIEKWKKRTEMGNLENAALQTAREHVQIELERAQDDLEVRKGGMLSERLLRR
jgi:hypothetical protein